MRGDVPAKRLNVAEKCWRDAKDGLPVGTGNLAAEVRTQASPRAGFKVELLPHIVHADVA